MLDSGTVSRNIYLNELVKHMVVKIHAKPTVQHCIWNELFPARAIKGVYAYTCISSTIKIDPKLYDKITTYK